MSRYIDAEWLKQNLNLSFWSEIGKIIDHAPSIDIVRCGECAKRKKNKFCLEHMRYERDDKGFCSYGERSSE